MLIGLSSALSLTLLGIATASTLPIAHDLVFQEKDGLVAIEAEHFASQAKTEVRVWHITSTTSAPGIKPDGDPSHAREASGGAYLELLPDTRRSHDDKLIQKENFTNEPGEMAVLTYKIHFTNPGRYYCWARSYSTNSEDNGIHLGINDTWPASGARMQWTAKNKWHWDCKQRTEEVHTGVFGRIWIDVPTAGDHRIHFSMREDGFEFDKFILTTAKPVETAPPAGHGPAAAVKEGNLPKPFPTTTVEVKPASNRPPKFPAHWGEPPRIQTKDFIELPEPYGRGSSTLKKWILENLTKDKTRQNRAEPGASAHPATPDLQQPRQSDGDGSATITGANTQWQPVTLSVNGPFAHELDQMPNPFLDYSLMVTFTHESGAPEYQVPGYFAADGNAGESSAQSGTIWRAHFSPDKPGKWNYHASFVTGRHAALETVTEFPEKAFTSLKQFNSTGEIEIKATPSDAPGFYKEGRLTYIGKPYLQFAGSRRYFLKAGADAPETLLAYADFDGTTVSTKKVPLKTYQPHLQDWKEGDPTWKDGKGKGLIGALNYLSGKGMNAFSFLPYNAGGDGDNVWPFVSRDKKFHYDCSKLDQWNIVFTHGQAQGLFLHFKLQETENDDNNRGHGKENKNGIVPTSLDGGDLGPERKLYLRELVARFGHHLALNWNLGEENTQTTKQQMEMATYLRAVDPYDHHLVVHTFPDQQDKVYKPLLGSDPFTGVSLQNSHLKDVHWQTVKWNREAIKSGKPWCIAFDEPGDAQYGMPPDPDYPGMPKDYKGPTIDLTRQHVLWGNLMGGGWGVEYYFGYKLPENDLVCQDWRSRDQSWDYAKIALDFFTAQKIPFWEMTPQDELVGNPQHENTTYCLGKTGLYLIYFPNGKKCRLTIPSGENPESIQWFNPRNGKSQDPESWKTAPALTCPPGGDWLAIIRTK